jgi:hypothetical protein
MIKIHWEKCAGNNTCFQANYRIKPEMQKGPIPVYPAQAP